MRHEDRRGSRRFALRAKTADDHEALDRRVGSWATLDDYRRYLAGLAAFRLPLERSLLRAARPEAGWTPLPLAEALVADLGDLGLVEPSRGAASPETGTDGLLGVAYVLEGSALGARLLYKRAQELGLNAGFGARHLALLATSTSWPAFLGMLEAAEPFDIDRTADAASATFRAAERAFAAVDTGH